MTGLPFASFCNRHAGQTGWVVGRGPTRYPYENLRRVEGPVFFVNDAVGQETWLGAEQPSYFFAHDIAMTCWLEDARLRSHPVLIVDQPMTGPKECRTKGTISGPADPLLARLPRAILYRRDGPLDRTSLLQRSREEIGRSGQLYVGSGTIHPLLHFAWYVGCAKLNLIGCDGLPEAGYDPRLENRSGSTQQNALPIRVHQEVILRQLALPREYLGPIPSRIRMIMEIRAPQKHHDRLLACVALLLDQFRNFGCDQLVANDLVDQARGFWINGLWPDINACVECLAFPEHARLVHEAIAPLVGDLQDNYRVGYQAIA